MIVLHNGNLEVVEYYSKEYNTYPNITDVWTINDLHYDTLDKRLKLLKEKVCTSFLTPADIRNNILFITNIQKHNVKVVKVVTDYESDVKNLDPCWGNYKKDQWLENVRFGMSVVDEVILFKDVEITIEDLLFDPTHKNSDPVMFTSGRTGTHLLQFELLKRHNLNLKINHHNELLDNILTNSNHQFVDQLVGASTIFTCLTTNFSKLVVSQFVRNILGYCMVTEKSNYDSNVDICNDKLTNIREINKTDVLDTILFFLSFADTLLMLSFFKKPIYTAYLKDLASKHNNQLYLKNPYDVNSIVNTDLLYDLCKPYEETYNNVLNKIKYSTLLFDKFIYNK